MDNLARLRWWILGALVAVAVASSLAATLLGSQQWDGFLLNFGTEMAGAVATYALFELVIERREQQEARKSTLEARKAELIAQMGSDVRDVAVPAADELRRRGWLTDGSLRGTNLSGANLHGANLQNADLRKATLCDADLREAFLLGSDLRGAFLWSGEYVPGYAKLEGTFLDFADLTDAWVTDEQLAEAASLDSATLPDGKTLSREDWQSDFEKWRKARDDRFKERAGIAVRGVAQEARKAGER